MSFEELYLFIQQKKQLDTNIIYENINDNGEILKEDMITLLYNIENSDTNLDMLETKDVYKFNVQSISDWKNEYIKECSECIKKHECGGFFSSQVLYKRSQNIKPILNNYAN